MEDFWNDMESSILLFIFLTSNTTAFKGIPPILNLIGFWYVDQKAWNSNVESYWCLLDCISFPLYWSDFVSDQKKKKVLVDSSDVNRLGQPQLTW